MKVIKMENYQMEMKLTNLRLDLTSYCNQKCNFCPFHGYDQKILKGQYIDLEYYLKIADDIKEETINPHIRFVGSGEPTLYPQFEELIKYYKRKNFFLKLITNGLQLESQSETISRTIDSLIISVHGAENTHNNQVRSAKSYQNIMNGIEAIKYYNSNIDITLHFVITPQNYLEIEKHARLAASLNTIPRYQHLVFTKGNLLLGDFDLTVLKNIIHRVKKLRPQIKFIPELNDEQLEQYYNTSKPFIRNPYKCSRILTDLSIRFDGKVIMCDDNLLGDITEESIVNIINGKKRKDFVKKRLQRASKKGLPKSCSRCCYN